MADALSAAASNVDWGQVASIAGSTFSGISSMLAPAIGAHLSYEQSLGLMRMQQKFEERMSSTAIQRRVKDNIAAGVNPLYSMSSGQGASTPATSLAAAPDYASAASMATQNRLANILNRAQVQNIDSQTAINNNLAVKADADAAQALYDYDHRDELLQADLDIKRAQAVAALASGSASSAQASYYNSMKFGQDLQNLENQQRKPVSAEFYSFLREHPHLSKILYSGEFIRNFR